MPEELLATMPPIMHDSSEAGSGPILYCVGKPCSAARPRAPRRCGTAAQSPLDRIGNAGAQTTGPRRGAHAAPSDARARRERGGASRGGGPAAASAARVGETGRDAHSS
eukprot:4784888-Prymnesium_polylepis.1